MKKILILFFILLLNAWNLYAAELKAPQILLMYFQDIEVTTPEGDTIYEEDLEEEMPIPVGSTIVTGAAGIAELELDPNGSVIRLAGNTVFQITNLAGLGGNQVNKFKLDNGKFRSVAAAITGVRYEVEGPSSVCGVRGTDFGMDIDEGIKKEEAFVLDGLIDYSRKKPDGTFQTIAIGKGQKANAFSDDFQPIIIPPDQLTQLENELNFKKLKDKADKLKVKDEPTPETTPAPVETTTEPTPAPTPGPLPADDPLMKWLKDVLGMEIGSITIGDKTYSKAVLQPTFQFGKFKTALYLPVIYEKNMFDTESWYHPRGNDEWSFGTDQTDTLPVIADVLSDLFLKIKFLQWGDIRDDFFFKVGNLNNFTIGHGLVMSNYANDIDFPTIRRIGVNFGLDFKSWGFEALTNDLTEAEIFGSRVYFRPVKDSPFAIGASVVADINPAGTLPGTVTPATPVTAAMIGNPMFFNVGGDLEFPIVENDVLGIIFFTDVASMLPWFLNAGTDTYSAIKAGPAFQAFYSEELGLKNFGAAAGVFGNIFTFNYNVHARYFSGTFIPGFYGTNYDRISGDYAVAAADYINAVNTGADLSDYDTLDIGIYGLAGYTLAKVFSVEIGYMWPFKFNESGDLVQATDDEIHLKAVLEKGVIPGIEISGSLTYDRTNFGSMLAQKFGQIPAAGETVYDWIDEYSVLKGEVVYGVSPNLDLAALLTTAVSRADDGSIIYDPVTGNQEMAVTFSIETRVHF